MTTFTVPRLAKGKGYKGPEHIGCFNTGMAPAIFHSRYGKYVVGPELSCRDALRSGITLTNKRVWGEGRQRAFLFKSRGPAVAKFTEQAETIARDNNETARHVAELSRKAKAGDMAAVLALGDY